MYREAKDAMFSLLRAAFTLLICVLVIGFFLGWFTFSRSAPDPQTNKVNISVSVDKNKLGADLQKLEQKVSKGIQDFNTPQPANPLGGNPAGNYPPQGQANTMPRLSLGPLTIQPSGQAPAGQLPLSGQPQFQYQTPDYQFTLPLTSPAPTVPGEGR
jgi:hypothetical protein